ncbi:hypothetical protein [Albirhodobacter sp. R86504]|uniref:hypothetical protein n=1 Tax=Albirhodobacter sp. R86504 TaxID=3093848 RepID=UPI00366E4272
MQDLCHPRRNCALRDQNALSLASGPISQTEEFRLNENVGTKCPPDLAQYRHGEVLVQNAQSSNGRDTPNLLTMRTEARESALPATPASVTIPPCLDPAGQAIKTALARWERLTQE